MFLANLFAKSQPYSTKLAAEQALVAYIRKRDSFMATYGRSYIDKFNACIGQEDFSGALNVWNECIRNHWNANSLYLATVEESGLDKPFT